MIMTNKIFYILLLLLLHFSLSAQFIDENLGQKEIRTKRMVLKTNPSLWFLAPIPSTGEYRIAMETAIGLKNSVQISAAFVTKSLLTLLIEALQPDSVKGQTYTIKGYRFQFAYKFYPFGKYKNAPEGFFLGPHISYSKAYFHINQTSPKYSDYSATYANIALIWGYQFIVNDKIAIELFQGLGYRDNRLRDEYSGEEEKLNYNPDYTPIPGDLKIYLGANIGLNL